MTQENLFYTDNRWNNMYAYAEALKDLLDSGSDPLEEAMTTLALVLDQFPDSPPVDTESHHLLCVHKLVKTVLLALRKDKIRRMSRGEGVAGAGPENPRGPDF